MKYLLHQKTPYILCILCLSAMLFCGQAEKAYAAEPREEKIITIDGARSGILQAGGFLPDNESDGFDAPFKASSPNYTGAEKAIEKSISRFRNSIDVSPYHIPLKRFVNFYGDFLNHHPQFFYLDNVYSYTSVGGYVQTLNVQYISSSTSKLTRMVNTYEKKVKEILSYVDPSWSSLEKAMYINDYITLNCEYDLTFQKYNAYNVLVDGTAVCQGYTLAYLDLMNRLDIPCETVGSSSLNHIWNLVRINDSWYHVDVTWNDPIADRCGRARHYFLLKSTSWFLSTNGGHNASDYKYSGSLKASDASSTRFDDYFWNEVVTPFTYSNGHWYANVNHSLKEFSGSNAGLTENRTLKVLDDKWYVWGSSNSFWGGTYEGCSVFANKLYYATPTSIHALDLATNQEVYPVPYTLSAEEQAQGYIYGFHIAKDGTLEFILAQSPSEEGTHKKISIHTHSFGNWTVLTKNTCTKSGEQTHTCTTCSFHEEQTLPATGHLHTKTTTQKPTFLKKGSSKTVCQDCKATLENKTLAKVKCQKGKTYTVGNYKYKIISPRTDGKGTVAFYRLAEDVKTVKINDTVKILGVKFKIVQVADKALKNKTSVTSVTIGKNVKSIGKEAFYGTENLKSITIKSTKITKVGSKALKSINSKAKIKVPKSKLKKYKSLFKKKGQKTTVKIY